MCQVCHNYSEHVLASLSAMNTVGFHLTYWVLVLRVMHALRSAMFVGSMPPCSCLVVGHLHSESCMTTMTVTCQQRYLSPKLDKSEHHGTLLDSCPGQHHSHRAQYQAPSQLPWLDQRLPSLDHLHHAVAAKDKPFTLTDACNTSRHYQMINTYRNSFPVKNT